MTAHGLVVIGCGEFGAAAVGHLRERGAEAATAGGRRAVGLATLTGKVTTRQQAEDVFAAVTQGGWVELDAALGRVGAAPLIALIGAADDAAGGGLLVAALRYLTAGRHGRTRAVWLALPTSGSRTQARAYATLLELEVLRSTAALSRCFLREIKGDPLDLAGMFGEAAVAYAQGQPGVGMYAGFGLGAVRDVAAVVVEQAAVLAAQGLIEQRGLSKGYTPAGFGEALMRTADELFREAVPEAWLEQRWMTANRSHLVRHCLDEEYTGEHLAGFVERHMQFQDRSYRENPTWVADRIRALKNDVVAQIRDFGGKCGRESEAACQELADALAALRDAINRGIATHIKAQQSRLHEYESLRRQLADAVARVRKPALVPRKISREQRRGFLDAFEEIDLSGSSSVIATLRFQELRLLLTDVEKAESTLAGAVAAARKEGEARSKLREEVAGWPAAAEVCVAQGVHLFPPAPGAEAARRLADAVEPATLVAALGHARGAQGQAAALKNAALVGARVALERMPELLPARGDSARERWLSVVKPAPALAAVRTCRIGEHVSAQLRTELAQQLGGTAVTVAGKWFHGDGLVYCETDGVEIARLPALPLLQEAYAAQVGEQQGLHVLPAPADGWPDLLPVTTLPRKQLAEAATTVVRGCVLGLIGPAGDGGLYGRYLPEDGAAIHSVWWANLSEAVRRLAEQQALQDGLGAQAGRWLGRLDAQQLAGYYALVGYFKQSAAVTQLKGDVAALLTTAIAVELEGARAEPRAKAMAAQVGSPEDAFSLPAGEWRYLQW